MGTYRTQKVSSKVVLGIKKNVNFPTILRLEAICATVCQSDLRPEGVKYQQFDILVLWDLRTSKCVSSSFAISIC